MKFIISHDVDHLYRSDHYRDLFYPKLWIRETIHFIRGLIPFSQWSKRMIAPFKYKQHNIQELVDFDIKNNVPSTFFFGMDKGLGMSYDKEKALNLIQYIYQKDLSAGVHGICFDNIERMKSERNSFINLAKKDHCGIRMHYVRYNDMTLENLNRCGYKFDSSEFDKKKGFLIKQPYKVGEMWEFPLTIMDAYLPNNFNGAKEATLKILDCAEKANLRYITILFHDTFFCDAHKWIRDWYKWIIEHISDGGHSLVSYEEAIKELSKNA